MNLKVSGEEYVPSEETASQEVHRYSPAFCRVSLHSSILWGTSVDHISFGNIPTASDLGVNIRTFRKLWATQRSGSSITSLKSKWNGSESKWKKNGVKSH